MLFSMVIGLIILAASMPKAYAQSAFPIGGLNLDSAVEIKPGSYKGGVLKYDEEEGATQQSYFLSGVKPGQSIEAKVTFSGDTNFDLDLYGEDKIRLINVFGDQNDPKELVWLLDSSSKSGKYYLWLKNSTVNDITDLALDLKVVDRYDANSQTDAGGSIDQALPLAGGVYQGYFSGDQGNDLADFYKLTLKKGDKTTIKITPPNQDGIDIKIFDINKTEVDYKSPNNEGEITALSFVPANDGIYYIGLSCFYGCKKVVKYQMEISGAAIPTGGGIMTTAAPSLPTGSVTLPGTLGEKSRSLEFLVLIGLTVVVIIAIVYLILRKKPVQKDSLLCPKCKAKNAADTRFCGSCGTKL